MQRGEVLAGRQEASVAYPSPAAPTALRVSAGRLGRGCADSVRDRVLTQLTAGPSAGDEQEGTMQPGLGSSRRWPPLLLGDVRNSHALQPTDSQTHKSENPSVLAITTGSPTHS